jgi:hypothetical protein
MPVVTTVSGGLGFVSTDYECGECGDTLLTESNYLEHPNDECYGFFLLRNQPHKCKFAGCKVAYPASNMPIL